MTLELDTIYCGDCLELMKEIPDKSVDCCITSPPYYGLRDYGVTGQIGLEPTPEAYVARLAEVFREVRRVLKDEGTLWLNLGDSFWGGKGKSNYAFQERRTSPSFEGDQHNITGMGQTRPTDRKHPEIKPKDLIGIPWMVAFALRADGWYLRSDIIWHKPNCMPESVRDRPTKSHEYLFLLSKSQRYYYDAEAIKEANVTNQSLPDLKRHWSERPNNGAISGKGGYRMGSIHNGRNKRTVWTIPTKPFPGSHFAVMPEKLVEPCVLAGTSERGYCPKCGKPWLRQIEHKNMVIRKTDRMAEIGEFGRTQSSGTMLSPAETKTIGWLPSCQCASKPRPGIVLDPFSGAGTVALVAKKLGRRYIGIELNPEYVEIARNRIAAIPARLDRWGLSE